MVLKIIKINDKIIIATIKITVIILVTMQKHNHTNDINNEIHFLKNLRHQVLLSSVS